MSETTVPASVDTPSASSSVRISLTCDPRINFAFQQNAIPVVREIRVANEGPDAVRDVVVHVTTEPAFALPLELHVQEIGAGGEFRANPVELVLNPTLLHGLVERMNGLLRVDVITDGTTIASHTAEIALLARQEWCGLASLPEILAAFVQPNDPAVMQVLDRAAPLLQRATGRAALNGYQDRSRQRAWEQVAAIHGAIASFRLRYISAPASFEETGQKVRLPGEVLDQRFGTCLDLALLHAACCEQAGLHPLVLIHEGHAYAGCWLDERTLPEAAIDDLQLVRKLVDVEELTVFETSAVTHERPGTLDQAELLAQPHLAPGIPFRLALDVRRARIDCIRPLPIVGANASPTPAPASPELPTAGIALGQRTIADAPVLAKIAAITEPSRIDHWKSRLLDLTLRNRLLNFRPTLGTVQMLCPDPERVEDELADSAELRLQPRPSVMTANDPRQGALPARRPGEDPLTTYLREELAQGRLHTDLEPAEHQRRLTDIFRAARLGVEENGANTLFAAVGILEWRETAHSERILRAPLLLVPVQLKRKSVLEGFSLRRIDEETRLNVTLVEMLRQHFHKEVPGLDPLPEDENGVDAALVLRRFQDAVRDLPGWEVKREVWLGQFSFTKFLLWKDLADRLDELTRNRVVHHLVHEAGATFPNPPDDVTPQDLDDRVAPGDVCCPRSADSSQLAAVLAAAAGHDFVLEGPPGTGKSQTITNIIAHCLAHGKRVLFVAEKRAALDVVHRRLKEEGLEPFCLELHSNKTGKADVLAQFKQVLDFAGAKEPAEWQTRATELQRVRDELNAYARALHRPHPCGLSAYACFDHLFPRREQAVVKLDLPAILEQTTADLEQRRASASALAERAAPLAPLPEHPLAPLHCTEWSPSWDERAREQRTALGARAAAASAAALPLRTWLQLPSTPASRRELIALDELAALLLEPQPIGAEFLAVPWEQVAADLERWHARAVERQELRRQLAGFNEPALLALDVAALHRDWQRAHAAWWLPRVLGVAKVRSILSAARTDGNKPPPEQLFLALPCAVRLREITAGFTNEAIPGAARLGTLWNHNDPAPESIAAARAWGEKLQAQLAVLAGADPERLRALRGLLAGIASESVTLFTTAPIGDHCRAFRDAWWAAHAALDTFAATVVLDRDGCDNAPDHLEAVQRLAEHIADGWRDIRYWCAWQRVRRDAQGLGLAPLIAAIETGNTAPNEAPALFERSFRRGLFDAILEADDVLRSFFGHEHDTRIRRFRELDERMTGLTRELLRARLAAGLPGDRAEDAPPKTELGLLRKEVGKRARHLPVRQLLARIPTLLPRLKPCVLMSPLSVAQYLEPSHQHFDVVIFDEASQIAVWDAVGAIARGRQLVVVGDPKQLPPTTFFQHGESRDDEDESLVECEDLESILDELLSHGLRHKHLQWHYRSRHEGLIAFSNRYYYDDHLLTFPSPQADHGGVRFRHVEHAHYEKGSSRTNRGEAEALVTELVTRLRDAAGARLSYGVVTFSQAQQELIENLLDEKRREVPEIEVHFGEEPPIEGEPVFVKNLENVQGDERDVILFSICYGPDERGAVSMNFGPLNRDGGERRLNVAITRARQEILVFTTLRGDAIDLTRSRARGVRDLKHFLDYAERGPRMLAAVSPANTDAAPASEFEQHLAGRLRAVGYEVRHQVGCSGYRIDLAVVDPTAPDRYLLGIACDGATYRRAATARDRDKLRQVVLESLGWRLHRVWSTDWWYDSEREFDRLLAAIAVAPRANPPPPSDGGSVP